MIYDADGSEVIVIADKPTAHGDEPLCLRGCNCRVCRVRRYASALRFKGHAKSTFIVDPKNPNGFWFRAKNGKWSMNRFGDRLGMAKPEVAEAAAAALTVEPLTALDFKAGSDKALYQRAIRKAKQAQRRLRIENQSPQFFAEDMLFDVSPPLCECPPQCCDDPPSTLTANLSGPTTVSVTMTYSNPSPGIDQWQASFTCGMLTDNIVRLRCQDGVWAVLVRESGNFTGEEEIEVDCSGGSISISTTFPGNGNCGAGDWTVNIS